METPEYRPSDVVPLDAAFMEEAAFLPEDYLRHMCAVFGIPSQLIGWHEPEPDAREQAAAFVRDVVIPTIIAAAEDDA